MITKNVGGIDRIIRLVAGLALAYAAYGSAGPAAYILWGAAAMAVFTGLMGWCGLYRLFGLNTCGIADKP